MVGELYSYIFHFLTCAMKYFQSNSGKKMLDAMNEGFLASFDTTLAAIEALKARIHQNTSLNSQAEVKDIHSLLKDMARSRQEEKLMEQQRW